MATPAPSAPVIGILGGSGIYEIEGLRNTRWRAIATPFGDPSDELFFGDLNGQEVVFLPRHGRGHKRSPTDLNYRANVCALKMAGATEIISLSACGSLRGDLAPGTFVIADQFIDRTFARVKTFFEPGLVAHVSMAHPTCGRLSAAVAAAAQGASIPYVLGGTYLAMEGPQFSTLAESNLYRSWGAAIIGMTNMPEAKLAREAELCYATVGMVTDYDCWHEDHGAVTVAQVIQVLLANAEKAKRLVQAVVPALSGRTAACPMGCHHALDNAIITSPAARDPVVVRKLAPICSRVIPAV